MLGKLDVCMWKNANRPTLITLQRNQLHIDQRVQHKNRYTEIYRKESGNSLEFTGTGEDIPNKTLLAQALRLIFNKWDLMKVKSYCTTYHLVKDAAHRTGKTFRNYIVNHGLNPKYINNSEK